MTEYNLLIDSSAWLDYFLAGSKESTHFIEHPNSIIYTSAISLHEIKKKLIRAKHAEAKINEAMDFIKNKSIIMEITAELCEKSANEAIRQNLCTTDAIIYCSAQEKNALLITMDSHFKAKKNVKII